MGNVSSDYEEDEQPRVVRKKINKPPQNVPQQKQNIQQQSIQKQNIQQQYQKLPVQQNLQSRNYNIQQQYYNQQPQYGQQQYYNQQHPQYAQQQYYNQQQPFIQQHPSQRVIIPPPGVPPHYMNVNQIEQMRRTQQAQQQQSQHAFPQFPNRIHKPTDDMVKNFQQNSQNGIDVNQTQIMPYPSSSSYLYDDRSLDMMIERPLPNIEFNKSNFNDRIQEYETNYEKEEHEFEEYEKERRNKYKSYMNKKRDKLKDAIRQFENQYNPYEILGLENGDLDLSNIRKAYKKMALKYHPDKAGEEYTDQFQVITQSYIYLLKKAEDTKEKRNDYESQNINQNHIQIESTPTRNLSVKSDPAYDLANKIAERSLNNNVREEEKPKRGRKKVMKDTRISDFISSKKNDNAGNDEIDVNQNNFDINKFNTLFEKYRTEDDNDKGYGDLLKKGKSDDDDDDSFTDFFNNKNMSKDVFNAHFDNIKKKKGNQKNDPLLPDAFDSSSNVNCAQIGNANNFSNSGKYTDIKQAYYEDNMLIDPNSVKTRKDYRKLQELENERSRLSYDVDPETKRIYDQYERDLQKQEDERVNYLKNRDDAVRSHHNYVSRKLFVNGKKVE